MTPGSGPFLRWIAALIVRGPGAPFVLGDLEETLRREVARGVPLWRARGRYLSDAVSSAVSLARVRLRVPRLHPPAVGMSWLDVKLGVRMLTKQPLLTAVSVFSLAVGIPVGLAPGHLADALVAPLPVEDGDRIVGLSFRRGAEPGGVAATPRDVTMLRDALESFQGVGAVRTVAHNLAVGDGLGAPVSGAEVTASAFPILSTRPLLGRALQGADEAPGAPDVVVLGYDVWRARLAGDPDVLGDVIHLDGVPHTVVGVMPRGFLFPVHQEMWLPLRSTASGAPDERGVQVFARLADGATPETAQRELRAVVGRAGLERSEPSERIVAEVAPFPVAVFFSDGGLRGSPEMWILHVGAFVLLMVACVNVGLLVFARTATRSAELAVRTALGASRRRIVGQVFIEALVLAGVSAGAGLLLLNWLPNRLLAVMWSPDWGGLPWWIDLGVTSGTVARALILAVVSAVVASVVPALRVTGKGVGLHVRRATTGGHGGHLGGMSSVLVAADVAVAVAVVGLVIGISKRMGDVTAGRDMGGLRSESYLAVDATLGGTRLAPGENAGDRAGWRARLAADQQALVKRIGAEPGVLGVAVADRLPRMDHPSRRGEVEGGATSHSVVVAHVEPGFFAGFDRPVVAGRDFNAGDLEGDRTTVIVNTGFADSVMAGTNPVGRRFRYLNGREREPGPWYDIVGMVGDLGMDLIDPEDDAGVYHPAAPGEIHPLRMAIRLRGDPASFAPRVRELAARVDPSVMITRSTPLDRVYPDDWYLIIGLAAGWTLFVGILVSLASSGIYAIMAYAVAQRTREIGIRAALGAHPARIAATIGRRAVVQLAVGALLGMPLAGWLYHMICEDPSATRVTLLAAVLPGIGVVLFIGLLACTAPLARALRIMPTEAMRTGS